MRCSSYLSVSAVALAVAGGLWLARRSSRDVPSATAVLHALVHALGSRREDEGVQRGRYVLDYHHEVGIAGRPAEPTWVRGIWTAEPVRDGRVEVALTGVALGGAADATPAAQEMAAPFQVALDEGGRLERLGFAPDTALRARGLLTTLACAFAYTPGEGERWSVEEEDRTGRYVAAYEREGDEVTRRRVRYLAARGPGGLDARADRVSATGATRFRLDAQGISEVEVDEHVLLRAGSGVPDVEVHVTASLHRVERRDVPLRAVDLLLLENDDPPRGPGAAHGLRSIPGPEADGLAITRLLGDRG